MLTMQSILPNPNILKPSYMSMSTSAHTCLGRKTHIRRRPVNVPTYQQLTNFYSQFWYLHSSFLVCFSSFWLKSLCAKEKVAHTINSLKFLGKYNFRPFFYVNITLFIEGGTNFVRYSTQHNIAAPTYPYITLYLNVSP